MSTVGGKPFKAIGPLKVISPRAQHYGRRRSDEESVVENVGTKLHSILLSCALATAVLVCGTAWAESAKEAKKKIHQDVKDKERAVQLEEKKLKSLYIEQQTLDPDARLNELSNKAAKSSMEAAKMVVDQIKTGPINSPKMAAVGIGRGKDVVDKYREIWKADDDAFNAVSREQDLRMFDIPSQERKLEKAKVDFGVAKIAAGVVIPLLDAMEEAERIDAKRKAMAKNHQKGDAEARRQFLDHNQRSSKTRVLNQDPTAPSPGQTLPQTRATVSRGNSRPSEPPAPPPPQPRRDPPSLERLP